MSLRQKLVFVTKPHVTKINYDEALAQVVPQSKRNRLTSESIRSEIKPFLRNYSMSDEDLIFAVGQAAIHIEHISYTDKGTRVVE